MELQMPGPLSCREHNPLSCILQTPLFLLLIDEHIIHPQIDSKNFSPRHFCKVDMGTFLSEQIHAVPLMLNQFHDFRYPAGSFQSADSQRTTCIIGDKQRLFPPVHADVAWRSPFCGYGIHKSQSFFLHGKGTYPSFRLQFLYRIEHVFPGIQEQPGRIFHTLPSVNPLNLPRHSVQ